MSKKVLQLFTILAFTVLFNQELNAQTPGLIIKPATAPGNSVLDPDGDGYVSQKTNGIQLGFTIPPNNDVSQSEIPYAPIIRPDPLGDVLRGPVGGYSDIVGIDAAGNSAILTYNDGTNLLFRFRLGGYAPNSKSYSILIDTDGKFGFTGPNADLNAVVGNPGFEVEIVLETNFNVKAFNVDGVTAGSLIPGASYSYDINCQKSVAVSTAGGDPDYFYDFYLPLSSLSTLFTASTPLRIVAVTTMNPYPAIGNALSDIGGVGAVGSLDQAFINLIDAQTPTVPGSEVLDRTTCPTITGSYTTTSTTVSGTSTEANGTLIQVYKNSNAVGSAVQVAGGTWSVSGLSFVANDVITATATAPGKGTSFANCSSKTVTAAACATAAPTSIIFANSGKVTVGFAPASSGTTITVYNADFTIWKSGPALLGTTSLQLSGGIPLTSNGKVPDGTYYASVTFGGCESTKINACNGSTITNAPTINSPIVLGSTSVSGTGIVGDNIIVYADGVQIAIVNNLGSTSWSVTVPALSLCQVITAKQSKVSANLANTGSCMSVASNSVTVTRTAAKPIITSTGCNTNPVTISGSSTEADGTVVTLYKTNPSRVSLGTATVTSGAWSVSGLTLTSGNILVAAVTSGTCLTASVDSDPVTISIQTSLAGYTIGVTAPTEGQTSVSGTISGGSYPVTLKIYEDETLIGSGVSIASAGSWTVTGLSSTDLYVGGKLKVTLTSATGCESILSAELATVQCISPAMPTYTGGSMSYCYGGAGQLTLTTSQTGVIYQLVNGSGQSQGAAFSGTGGAITLYTNQLTSNLLNIYVKAYKIGSSTCSTTSVTAINFDTQLASPSVTFTTSLSVQQGTTSVNLPFSAKSGSAVNYTIDYPAYVNSQGFTDIITPTAIPAAPGNIALTVPVSPAIGTYPGTITIYQASGCTASYSFSITVYGASSPPVISVQPMSKTICSGTTTLSVAASGSGTLTYQWQSSSSYSGSYSIVGSNSPNYTTASLATTTYYRVIVSNTPTTGSVTSNIATVTVTSSPSAAGTITGSSPVCAGQTGVAYSVGAIANATSYTWSYTGTGATFSGTTNSININFASNATSGNLTVQGTNACGNGTVSANYAITVNPLPTALVLTGSTICTTPGGTGTITSTTSVSGVNYQLYNSSNATVGSTKPGTGSALTWSTLAAGTGYYVIATHATTSCISPSSNSVNVATYANPTITTTGTAAAVCYSASGQTTTLAYTATTNSPTSYSIDWNAVANAAGLADQGSTAFIFVPGGGSLNTIAITGGTLAGGPYSGTMTITNANGCTNTQAVSITVNATPTTATVGSTQNLCGTLVSAALGGNTPGVGTGAWSIVSGGTGTFSAPGSGSSTFTADAYGSYVLRWTISNGTCTPSTADVTVNYYAIPTTATVGSTQNLCGTLVSAALGGNTPGVGTGAWSIVSGGTGTFSAPGSGSSTFTANAYGTYVLRWTISNGTCTPSTADVTVNYYATPTITTGGTAAAVCYSGSGQTTSLAYSATTNLPTSYSIDWDATANAAGLADQGSTAFTFITGGGTLTGIVVTAGTAAGGPYSGTMTITNGNGCTATQAVTLTVNALPLALVLTGSTICTTPGGTGIIISTTSVSGVSYQLYDAGNATVQTAQTGTGSGLTWSTLAAGTGYYVIATNGATCTATSNSVNVATYANPTITTAGTAAAVCYSGSGQTTSLAYSATTNLPTSYSIDWDATANAAGLADQGSTAFTFLGGGGSLNTIAITAATVAGGPYSGTMTITNANGCTNTQAVTVTVTPNPDLTGLTTNATNVCAGNVSVVTLAATSLPNGTYTVNYTLTTTNAQGPTDVSMTVAGGTNSGTFNTPSLASAGTTNLTINSLTLNLCTTSTSSGNTASIIVSETGTWLGITSTDWNTGSNWCGGIPTSSTDVIIPSTAPYQPIIGAAGGLCRNITINAGASLTISSSNTLTVSGNFANNGGTFSPGTGTVTFNGTSNQVINGTVASQTFYNVIVNKSSNTLSVGGSTTSLTVNNLTETAGNFTSPATFGINGNLTLTAGTFTAGSTTTIAGNWTNNSGTFTSGSGTVTFNGSGSQTFGGTSSSTFNNLTLNNTAGATLAQSQTINGTLTLTSGAMTVGAYTLTIAGNSPVRTSGTLDAGNAGATLAFTNSSAITLPASIFTGAVNNMTINGAGGVTASSDFTVNGILYLQSANPSSLKGSLDMGSSSVLTMGSSATTTGAGDVTGIVKRTSFVAATSYTFGNQYTTIDFQTGGTLPTDISVKIAIGSAPSWKTDAILRTYDIVHTGGSGTLILNLHYLDSELNANPEADLSFWDYRSGIPEIDAHKKTSGSTIDNWAGISNLNISYFPTVFDDHIWTLSKEIYAMFGGIRGWRMITSPTLTTSSDFLTGFISQGVPGASYPTNQPNFLRFDETDTLTTNMSWRTSIFYDNLVPGRGYYFYVFDSISGIYSDTLPRKMSAGGNANYTSGTFSFSGGNQHVTFSHREGGQIPGDTLFYDTNISDEGWNLLGNPTYSTLDWDASTGWTKTNLDGTIYIWDPGANSGNGEYKVWNGTNGSLGNGLIASYQAFWVHAFAAFPGLSFTNSVLTSGGTFYGGGVYVKSLQAGPNPSAINLSLNAGGLESTAIISFMADAKVGPDNWDAYRLEPLSDSWLELFTLSSPSHTMPLVINNLPVDKPDFLDLPLFVGGQQHGQSLGGNYTLHWELPPDWPADWAISLNDHLSEKAISMRSNQNYDFDLSSNKSSVVTTDSIGFPMLPANIINPVSQKSMLKSTTQLPRFSIIIQKGTYGDDPVYITPQAELLQNYPNPFSNSTTLRFSLPLPAYVTLKIYDFYGQLIDVAADRHFEAGIHNLPWNRGNAKSGIYLLQMHADDVIKTKKLVITTQ